MKYKIVLQAQVFANSNVNDNINEVVKLCNKFDVPIGFDFMGIYIIAFPGSEPHLLIHDYLDQLDKQDSKIKVDSELQKKD